MTLTVRHRLGIPILLMAVFACAGLWPSTPVISHAAPAQSGDVNSTVAVPSSPVALERAGGTGSGFYQTIAVSDTLAYLGGPGNRLTILDVTNAATPVRRSYTL